MIHPQAQQYLQSAINALLHRNFVVADRDLEYATEEWPDHCDLHRALAFSRVSAHGGHSTPTEISRIREIEQRYKLFLYEQ